LQYPQPQTGEFIAFRQFSLGQGCEYGLQIATHHLASETNGFAQLLRYFGGAYEVATYENRKFRKSDGATYVFWHGYKG
jgi:hypothetical protein